MIFQSLPNIVHYSNHNIISLRDHYNVKHNQISTRSTCWKINFSNIQGFFSLFRLHNFTFLIFVRFFFTAFEELKSFFSGCFVIIVQLYNFFPSRIHTFHEILSWFTFTTTCRKINLLQHVQLDNQQILMDISSI